jgi:hypothetical protein
MLAVLAFIGFMLQQSISFFFTRSGSFTGMSARDIIEFAIFFSIVGVYAVNFYYGMKMLSQLKKEPGSEFNNMTRMIFFTLEIILAFLYSLMLYRLIKDVRLRDPGHPSTREMTAMFVLAILIIGYISSLARLLLTGHIVGQIGMKQTNDIDLIGK